MKLHIKWFAAVLVLAMLMTAILPVVADDFKYSAEAEKLYKAGLYKGISQTTFEPDLKTALDRQTGVVMLLRMFSLEAAAQAMSEDEAKTALAKMTDTADIASWALKHVAYAVKNSLVKGMTDTTFAPKLQLNGKMYATLLLRQMGYTVDSEGYAVALTTLKDKNGLTEQQVLDFNKDLIKDDLVGISFGALMAVNAEGKKVIEKLITDGTVKADDVAEIYKIPEASPVPKEVKIEKLTAVNGILVVLMTARPSADPQTSEFKVTQAINGAAAVPVTITNMVWDGPKVTATIGVPYIQSLSIEQNLVYTLTYKEYPAVTSDTIKIAAIPVPPMGTPAPEKTIELKSVSAINGILTAALMEAPASVPVSSDFIVTKSINSGAAEAVVPSDMTWGAATMTATVTLPLVLGTTSEQSVVYTVKFKTSAAKTTAAFTVPAGLTLAVAENGIVSNYSLQQFDVSFDAAVAAATLTANTNVKVTGKTIVSLELDATEKKMTVILSEPVASSTVLELDINGVARKDSAATTITGYKRNVTLTDARECEVVVTATSTTVLVFAFSEVVRISPLNESVSWSTYEGGRIDTGGGNYLTGTFARTAANYNTYTFTMLTPLASGTNPILIDHFFDAAGTMINSTATTVTVP